MRDLVSPGRARPPLAQTFVKEDAGDPERGEKQREVLAAVHSAVEAGQREGAGGGLDPAAARAPSLPAPSPPAAPHWAR